jgi:sulfate adenylyltransferase
MKLIKKLLACIAVMYAQLSHGVDITQLPSIIIDERTTCDLRLIASGALAPLEGFMNQEDYESVLENLRLKNGSIFPLPVVLSVSKNDVDQLANAKQVVLRNVFFNPLAVVDIEDIYEPDLEKEATASLGTTDENHPFMSVLNSRKGQMYIGGRVHALDYLKELDINDGVLRPEEIKQRLSKLGHANYVAFQTRNPLHQAHVALINDSLSKAGDDAVLLLQPVIGPTQAEDIDPITRKKCYEAILDQFGSHKVLLTYLPLAMRMAGPKEALFHALIRKNCGATHFIVGRDHAGPSSKTKEGKSFYHPLAAQELVESYAGELGVQLLKSQEMVYVFELDKYIPENKVAEGQKVGRVSGTELRSRLQKHEELPEWFSYPKVLNILKKYYSNKKGVCVYLTGLSGSGKSTIAQALKAKLDEDPKETREVVILDGDEIRRHLSAGLGFSKKDRSINVQRIGYTASLVVRSGAICICANIAPYSEDRLANRSLISKHGKYIEVFVNTPLEVCEQRDVKGLYKMAREGKIKEFTGISDPYETPVGCELELNDQISIDESVNKILKLI